MPETIGGRSAIRSSPYAIRHTPSQVSISRDAFPATPQSASYVRMNFVTWRECYNVRVLQTVQLHERGSQHGTSHDHGGKDTGRPCASR